MVVVAIVGVLSAVGLPQLTKAQDKAKDSTAIATLTNAAKECALELVTGADSYEFDTDSKFASVVTLQSDGSTASTDGCVPDGTLIFASEAGDNGAGGADGTEAFVVFDNGVPGVVELRADTQG